MDIVITDPTGVRRMFGNVNANVTNGPSVVPTTPFTGAGGLGTLKLQLQPTSEGLGPSPLFGIPMPAPLPPGNPPTGFINLILSLAAEPSPRQAPRLPMMARFETGLTRKKQALPFRREAHSTNSKSARPATRSIRRCRLAR